jgi:vacuolar-type H+-ATPase subunit F/Vma7
LSDDQAKVAAIVSPDLAPGFELAGVEAARAHTAREASDLVNALVESGEYGIIIIDERFMSDFDESTAALCAASRQPIIVALPGRMKWPRDRDRRPDDYAMHLIRRAIGRHVRIQL